MNKKYSKELKLKVINEYFEGESSIIGLARKYEISDDSIIHRWIKRYQEEGPTYFEIEHRGRGSTGRPRKDNPVNLESMTKDERLAYLEMENAILKKLKALMEAK